MHRVHRACVHVAGLLSILLEQKTELGLAQPPVEITGAADEEALVEQALEERAKRAKTEPMKVRSADPSTPWTDYTVSNASAARRTASRCAARNAACPTAPARTSRRTRSGPASTS